jgi:hypothetical protein
LALEDRRAAPAAAGVAAAPPSRRLATPPAIVINGHLKPTNQHEKQCYPGSKLFADSMYCRMCTNNAASMVGVDGVD